jgi:hypothetical protein
MPFTQVCAAPSCTAPSTPTGEHVLPNWLMRAFTTTVWSAGPYSVESSTTGVEHTSDQPVYVKLPCCQSHNAALDTNFETHGQEAAKNLFGIATRKNTKGNTTGYDLLPLATQSPLDNVGTDRFARWLLKTMILNHHPETVRQMNGQPVWKSHKNAGFPTSVFADIFAGKTPDGMNAWIAVSDPKANADQTSDVGTRVQLDSAHGYQTALATWGLGLRHGASSLALDVQVAWAPNMIVLHPDEETGAAQRIWPHPPTRLRIADMPVMDASESRRFRSTFFIGGSAFASAQGFTPVIAEDAPTMSAHEAKGTLCLHGMDGVDTSERAGQIRTWLEANLMAPGAGETTEN